MKNLKKETVVREIPKLHTTKKVKFDCSHIKKIDPRREKKAKLGKGKEEEEEKSTVTQKILQLTVRVAELLFI